MPRRTATNEKNLISTKLVSLRKQQNLSQSDLADKLQLAGYPMDTNAIILIENNQRLVTDKDLMALSKVLDVKIEFLIGWEDPESRQPR